MLFGYKTYGWKVLLIILVVGIIGGFVLIQMFQNAGDIFQPDNSVSVGVEVEYKDGTKEMYEPGKWTPFAIYVSGSNKPVSRWIIHVYVKAIFNGQPTGWELAANYKIEVEDANAGVITYRTDSITARGDTIESGVKVDAGGLIIINADDLENWMKSQPNFSSGTHDMDVVLISGTFTLYFTSNSDSRAFSNARVVITFDWQPDGISSVEITLGESVSFKPMIAINNLMATEVRCL